MTASAQSPFDAAHSGVYRTPPALDLLQQAAARVGIVYFALNLRDVTDKRGFLAACSRALGFPASFGYNWDAFSDSIQDLSWHAARGYVVHIQHAAGFARAAPQDYATAVEIFGHAAQYWKARATTFVTLMDDAADLPVFAA